MIRSVYPTTESLQFSKTDDKSLTENERDIRIAAPAPIRQHHVELRQNPPGERIADDRSRCDSHV